MASTGRRWQQFLQEMFMVAGTSASAYFLIRYLLSRIDFDPESQKKEEQKRKSTAILRRLDAGDESDDESPRGGDSKRGKPKRAELTLNQYEQAVAMDVVAPEDISVTFEDIGGLDHIIKELKQSVIYPLTMPHLYASTSSLLTAPSGVLLYGPPGCGKTMMAKALAHESGACFINLRISTLTEKWYGDSNKLVNAVFSLARKLQPSIVFIDEIDAILGTRRSGEHEASGMVKAEFMTHWDGLTSANSRGEPQRIVVLGATNRINDIDEAILRRMPKKFPVGLPSDVQRLRILSLVLKDTKVDREDIDVDWLVKKMAGLSGSDIKEQCRSAAIGPLNEQIEKMEKAGLPLTTLDPSQVRGLSMDDFPYGRRPKKAASQDKVSAANEEEGWQTESEAEGASEAEARYSVMAEPPE
ncbi:unnamed protein product [Penicillium pancosmium]